MPRTLRKFKVGDRVEYICSGSDEYTPGQICTITEYCDCEKDECTMVATDVTDKWYADESFDLVPKISNAERVAERRAKCSR